MPIDSNARRAATSSGAEAYLRLFEPFGLPLRSVAVDASAPQIFAGQRYESVSDLYDFNARWYDAVSARFLSIDPIVPSPQDPLPAPGRM